ncbi:putative O-glycosylation ligase, exosortase A system-associated [Rhodoferax sp.]|uniref:putative O-glycosylation ligase, exosortase A system-associated n=1 Tax=Rhodoferax sp. TaxID=50421 RepID=UPI00374DFAA8
MRDILIISIVFAGAFAALRQPWIGVMLWTWLSIMNPHRYSYGFAYDAPVAAIAFCATILGLIITKDRTSPFKAGAVTMFVMFMVWISLSTAFGLDPADDYWQWNKVMKVDAMIIVALMLLHSRKHILALTWVAAGSLALLGAKGGLFTLMTGGNFRVWGPPGSFIEDNNEFALSLVMAIPLLRFLQMQLLNRWGRHVLSLVMLLCVAASLGSYSRGALLAISAMAVFLWWNGKNKPVVGMILVLLVPLVIAFMPDAWMGRMSSIGEYQEDDSSMGRISAWWNAWNIAFHYPFGVGFNAARPELFAQYSPYPDMVHAAHSIYFQVLGNHGFIGLFLFLSIWLATWSSAGWLRTHSARIPEAAWCADLGAMCQVCLVGYAVGGAFLSLAYFDLPYNVMVLVVVARVWVQTRGWEREAAYVPGWKNIPGLARKPPVVAPVKKYV